jgi:ATP-dependent RNA helicase DeaD
MSQDQRDRVMDRLRSQTAELLVATDVAARGLDIDHLTHVVNYDVPSAAESYVHRIGRVGRGGREGVAITLAEPREQRLLQSVERITNRKISIEPLPTVADLLARRLEGTVEALREAIGRDDLDDVPRGRGPGAGRRARRHRPRPAAARRDRPGARGPDRRRRRAGHPPRQGVLRRQPRLQRPGRRRLVRPPGRWQGRRSCGWSRRARRLARRGSRPGRTRLFVSSGRAGGMRPQDLVGAIANESRLSGKDIGPIVITERFSLVDVPDEAATDVIHALQQTRVKGRKVQVRRDRGAAGGEGGASQQRERGPRKPPRKGPPRY